jgi:hypothetical protein
MLDVWQQYGSMQEGQRISLSIESVINLGCGKPTKKLTVRIRVHHYHTAQFTNAKGGDFVPFLKAIFPVQNATLNDAIYTFV